MRSVSLRQVLKTQPYWSKLSPRWLVRLCSKLLCFYIYIMGVIKFSISLSFYMYCRFHRVFQDPAQDQQSWSCFDEGEANSTEQQLLRHYAIVMLFAAKIAEKLSSISWTLIRIYQWGLKMDLLSKVRLQWNYIGCTLMDLFAAKIAEKLSSISCTLIRIYL